MTTISRLPLVLVSVSLFVACASPPPVEVPADGGPHIGNSWFEWRAQTLGITPAEARARDEALPNGEDGKVPAPGTLDADTQIEGALLWRAECARCHGANGDPPEPAPGQVKLRTWNGMGAKMGFTFGGDRMRAGVYRKILVGGGAMPGWKGYLSREQIWALVNHMEHL